MKKDLNIEEEKLKRLLGNDVNSFSVPEGYFEKLPGEIMDKINALPDFEKTSEVNPFSVPAGYFESLPSAITEKIANKSRGNSWLNIFNRPGFVIPAAFATIIILAGLFFIKQKNPCVTPLQEITAEDLKNSTYLQSIDEDAFVDALSKQKDLNSDESLEQYLIDNNIDLSQIENKL